jgi:hypothetical protein
MRECFTAPWPSFNGDVEPALAYETFGAGDWLFQTTLEKLDDVMIQL